MAANSPALRTIYQVIFGQNEESTREWSLSAAIKHIELYPDSDDSPLFALKSDVATHEHQLKKGRSQWWWSRTSHTLGITI